MTRVATSRGPARVDLVRPTGTSVSLLVLGHGAGGGVDAPDLVAVRDAALIAGVTVALVTQPYRVAGRRAPAPAGYLDEAWTEVLAALRVGALAKIPLVVGGRSSGARVACRTVIASGASGLLALAFPLCPPGKPDRSRAPELDTGIPTLVVNGDRDPFGVPESSPGVDVVVRPGARHDLRTGVAGTAEIVVAWLSRMGWALPPGG